MVTLFNHSSEPYEVNVGDGTAQINFQRYENAVFVKTDELSKTERTKGSFGSAGMQFSFRIYKMSHSRVIICLHVLQGFYDGNNQLCINLNSNFLCACKNVYGSILLYFCLCCECFEDLTKKNLTQMKMKILSILAKSCSKIEIELFP